MHLFLCILHTCQNVFLYIYKNTCVCLCINMLGWGHINTCTHKKVKVVKKNQEIFYVSCMVTRNLVQQNNTDFTIHRGKLNIASLEEERALTCFTTVTVPGAMVTTEATAVASWVSEPNSMICCRMFTAVGSSLSPYQKDSNHRIITVKQLYRYVSPLPPAPQPTALFVNVKGLRNRTL